MLFFPGGTADYVAIARAGEFVDWAPSIGECVLVLAYAGADGSRSSPAA
jgi:hypothetical protein